MNRIIPILGLLMFSGFMVGQDSQVTKTAKNKKKTLYINNVAVTEIDQCPNEGAINKKGEEAKEKVRNLNRNKNRVDKHEGSNDWKKYSVRQFLNPPDAWDELLDDQDNIQEDKAVKVTGFIAKVKVQKNCANGNGETCNCYLCGADQVDVHIDLVQSLDDIVDGKADKQKVMVVEFTPRMMKTMNTSTDEVVSALKQAIIDKKKVTFYGWLFHDWEHDKNSYNTSPTSKAIQRGTSWEIHPVVIYEIP